MGQRQLDRSAFRRVTQCISEQIAQFRYDVLDQFGIEASGDEKISTVISRIIDHEVSGFMGQHEDYLPPLLAGSVFLGLLAFNFLYQIIVRIIAYIFYFIMRISGFIIFKKESKEAEVLEL